MVKRITAHFLMALPGLIFMLFYLPVWPLPHDVDGYTFNSIYSVVIFFLFFLLFASNLTAGIMYLKKKFNRLSVYASRAGILLFILLIFNFIANLYVFLCVLNGIPIFPAQN